MLKQQVLAACRHLLAPIVRWLLRSGVTWAEFAELSKEVYVEVARRDGERPAAPEGRIAVKRCPAREMGGGDAGDARGVDLGDLPPVALDDAAHADRSDASGHAEGDTPCRARVASSEPARRVQVEVVVVVVRLEHEVDRREFIAR